MLVRLPIAQTSTTLASSVADQDAQIVRDIANLARRSENIDRLLERSDDHIDAIDWSLMTIADVEAADGHRQELRFEQFMIEHRINMTVEQLQQPFDLAA